MSEGTRRSSYDRRRLWYKDVYGTTKSLVPRYVGCVSTHPSPESREPTSGSFGPVATGPQVPSGSSRPIRPYPETPDGRGGKVGVEVGSGRDGVWEGTGHFTSFVVEHPRQESSSWTVCLPVVICTNRDTHLRRLRDVKRQYLSIKFLL